MATKSTLMPTELGLCRCTTLEHFNLGKTSLTVRDRIPLLTPWLGDRGIWIDGTESYYSIVPVCSARHNLLCFTFCADVLQTYPPDYCHNALVLGCGGGAVPRYLLEKYPAIYVDVVDYSEKIIEICQKYFLNRWQDSSRLIYHCMDARDYVVPETPYQFIFCDLFDGQSLAPPVMDADFALKLYAMLDTGASLIINCGFSGAKDVMPVYTPFFSTVEQIKREAWQTQVIRLCR